MVIVYDGKLILFDLSLNRGHGVWHCLQSSGCRVYINN